MAVNSLPNKFWRPLAEVKNFVEKMSGGVKLPQMSQKVKSFAMLSRKDKDILIRYLNERDCIHVIQARPYSGGNLTTFFYHHKFGLPDVIPGYDWSGRKAKITMPVEDVPTALPEPEPESETEPVYEVVPEEPEDDEAETETETGKPTVTDETNNNAETLRKRALEMLLEAETAERSRLEGVLTAEVKPKIDDFIQRLNQANDAVQSTLDTLYDQMADVDKISMEFRNFAASL